jgi:hypothetical protein
MKGWIETGFGRQCSDAAQIDDRTQVLFELSCFQQEQRCGDDSTCSSMPGMPADQQLIISSRRSSKCCVHCLLFAGMLHQHR